MSAAEHQVRDLPGLFQVRLVRHSGQLAVAAATQAAGQLAAAGDQERHVKLAAGDRYQVLDCGSARAFGLPCPGQIR